MTNGALPRSAPATPGGGAPELTFAVGDAGPLEHAAVPTLRFGVRIECAGEAQIRALALNVQLRIAATRRRYDQRAEERLFELFGRPEQWKRSLGSLHWCNMPLQVGAFEGSTAVDLAVTCTYDLEVTATRYFQALEDGVVPLEFLFGGTAFYAGQDGALQVAPIAWDREAEYGLPVAVWRETMDRHFPGSAWLRLGSESFERLHAYRAREALLNWDNAVDSLLRAAGEDGGGDKKIEAAPDGRPI